MRNILQKTSEEDIISNKMSNDELVLRLMLMEVKEYWIKAGEAKDIEEETRQAMPETKKRCKVWIKPGNWVWGWGFIRHTLTFHAPPIWETTIRLYTIQS